MKRVLIVEDNEDLVRIMEKRIRDAGFETQVERTGGDLMERLMRHSSGPDCLILDLMLPGRSGFDLLNGIKSVWPGTQIFIFSAHGEYKRNIPAQLIQGFFLKTDGFERLVSALKDKIGQS